MKKRQKLDPRRGGHADYQVSLKDYQLVRLEDDPSYDETPETNTFILDRNDRYIKRLTIEERTEQSNRPAWVIPLIGLLLILFCVFILAPFLIERFTIYQIKRNKDHTAEESFIHGDDIRLVKVSVSNIYQEPTVESPLVTQALLNTPVQMYAESIEAEKQDQPPNFYKVYLLSGDAGYIAASDITNDVTAIEPKLYDLQVVVAEPSVDIKTHARGGNLIVQAKQCTKLYVLYAENDLYRVALPDHQEGWIQNGGVVRLPLNQKPNLTNADAFLNSMLGYDETKYLEDGITNDGTNMVQIVQNAGYVNGLSIPKTLDEIWSYGEDIPDAYNDVDNTLNLDVIKPGDVIMVEQIIGHKSNGKKVIDSTKRKLAVYTGKQDFLTDSKRSLAILRVKLDQFLYNWKIRRVVRYFPNAS